MTKFGATLRKIRQKKGLYLKDVAGFMKWSVVYLSDIERGNRKPPAKDDIHEICKYLGIDSKVLLNFADTDRGYIELNLNTLSRRKAETALSLARDIEYLNDDEIEEINNILKKRSHNNI